MRQWVLPIMKSNFTSHFGGRLLAKGFLSFIFNFRSELRKLDMFE